MACSPRQGGNSDLAAALMARGIVSAGTAARVVHLRDHAVEPCRGCQACGSAPGFACPLMGGDHAEDLFRLMLAAPMLFFASPIYFYHVPALFKGFIDRAQRYYEARAGGDPGVAALPGKKAYVLLLGGRTKGERLFEGTLLTMRYFLWPFRAELAGELCLYGLDAPGDLDASAAQQARVVEFARAAWEGGGR